MDNLYDLIIIGGGPAGFSAAIYAARANLKVLVISNDQSGGQIAITSEIVNYPGVKKISGSTYMENLKKQALDFGAEFIYENVEHVDFSGDIKNIKTSQSEYKSVGIIIATGARPRSAGFIGEDTYKGRGIGYCATCDGQFFEGLDIFVVGGGIAACEESIFLTRYAKKVYLIVRSSRFNVPESIAEKVLSNNQIEVHFNSVIKEVSGDAVLRTAVMLNTQTGDEWSYDPPADSTFGIFIFAGYEPQSDIFKDFIALDKSGNIVTDDDLKTNIDGVYAAGDIRVKKLRQLVTAVSDGAIASTQAEKYIDEKKNELGIKISRAKPAPENKEDSVFSTDLQQSVKQVLDKFINPVRIIVFTDERDVSKELKVFIKSFAQLSDKVKVEEYSQGENRELERTLNITLYPTAAVSDADGNDTGIQFSGIPSGHEFNSFVLALYNIAGPGQEISPEAAASIHNITQKTNIKIGVMLSCTMCPDVVQAAQLMACKNKNITAQMIDVAHFPEFKNKYNIMSVPCIVINDETISFGKKSLHDLLKMITPK